MKLLKNLEEGIQTNRLINYEKKLKKVKEMQTFKNGERKEIPVINGRWHTIAQNPNLGDFDGGKQQEPVDFAIWQAANGLWQLWSCIRGTKCGGMTRLFYRWESPSLMKGMWEPKGIAMQADPKLGERQGGLQAPYVLKIDNIYYMFYGGWDSICLATSKDGVRFKRRVNANGQSIIFGHGKDSNPRDPMVVRIGRRWYCYYTNNEGCDYCRISDDLTKWSKFKIVAFGGQAGTDKGSAECPFVIARGPYYYLFRTQHYNDNPQTSVYCSKNPTDFGINNDKYFVCNLPVAAPEIVLYKEQYYIAALLPNLKGIRIAKLRWVQEE